MRFSNKLYRINKKFTLKLDFCHTPQINTISLVKINTSFNRAPCIF